MMVKNRNIPVLSLLSFLQGMVFYCSIPALYRQQYGLTLSDILQIESICWILTFLLEIPWGYFADRFGYRKTLIISNFVFFISKIVFFYADSYSLFLLERIFLAVSIAGLSGCDSALLYESSGGDSKARIYGLVSAAGTFGLIIAALTSPLILAVSMKLTAFLTIFPYGAAWLLSFLLKDTAKPPEAPAMGMIESFRNTVLTPRMILFLIAGAVISEIAFAAGVMLNQAQYIKAGIPVRYFGMIYAFMQLIPLGATMTYRLMGRIGNAGTAVLVFTIILTAETILSFTTSIGLSIGSIAFILLGAALFRPLSYSIKNGELNSRNRATALSVYAVIEGVTGAGINLITGEFADRSVGSAFLFQVILLSAIAAAWGWVSLKRKA